MEGVKQERIDTILNFDKKLVSSSREWFVRGLTRVTNHVAWVAVAEDDSKSDEILWPDNRLFFHGLGRGG